MVHQETKMPPLWLIKTRAPFLTATIVPILLGSLIAWARTGSFDILAFLLTLAAGGTRNPFNESTLRSGDYNRLVMDGRKVFTEAVKRMSEASTEVLRKIGRSISDVTLVIPHQANLRIIDAVGKRLGLSRDKVYVNVHEYGNTGSATVPFALWEAVSNEDIREGDLVVLTAFGAGFHWAAAAVQF
jgi:3-oxoacyl-[acyl-carrier-protein] synthase-3